MGEPRSVILITGCSSGIGAALAEEFRVRGCVVYATARQPETLAALAERGLRVLRLDVTDVDSIAAAAARLAKEAGRIDILVNNAGYAQIGAVVDLAPDVLRRQFETNVNGPVQVTRAFLPLMISQRSGRVVNVGSISGVVATPFAGAYCASKAAIHALTDAMRMELTPFGIKVIMVQPGAISSNVGETASKNMSLPADSIYASLADALQRRAQISQQGAMPAHAFARQVASALLADDVSPVLRGGPHSFRLPFLKRWLPTRTLDRKMSHLFGLGTLRQADRKT